MARVKTCFKCEKTRPASEFYKHPMMADGRLGKCKDCTKQDVQASRLARLEYYREYDRKRGALPHRAKLRQKVTKRWQAADPRRHEAHKAAYRHHRKAPDCCQMCGLGKRLERHHPDYDLPMLIVWLCKPCHVIADRQRRAKETS